MPRARTYPPPSAPTVHHFTCQLAFFPPSHPAGELWTRDWEAMPLPDLSQSATDAAAVLAEVAAVSGPAGGAQARQGGSRWGTKQQAAGQSPYAAAQQYAAAQAQQYKQQQQQQQYSQQQYAAQQRQMKQQQRQPKKWAQKQRVELDEERYGRRWDWVCLWVVFHGCARPQLNSTRIVNRG